MRNLQQLEAQASYDWRLLCKTLPGMSNATHLKSMISASASPTYTTWATVISHPTEPSSAILFDNDFHGSDA